MSKLKLVFLTLLIKSLLNLFTTSLISSAELLLPSEKEYLPLIPRLPLIFPVLAKFSTILALLDIKLFLNISQSFSENGLIFISSTFGFFEKSGTMTSEVRISFDLDLRELEARSGLSNKLPKPSSYL
jgi:hypothetical protein